MGSRHASASAFGPIRLPSRAMRARVGPFGLKKAKEWGKRERRTGCGASSELSHVAFGEGMISTSDEKKGGEAAKSSMGACEAKRIKRYGGGADAQDPAHGRGCRCTPESGWRWLVWPGDAGVGSQAQQQQHSILFSLLAMRSPVQLSSCSRVETQTDVPTTAAVDGRYRAGRSQRCKIGRLDWVRARAAPGAR